MGTDTGDDDEADETRKDNVTDCNDYLTGGSGEDDHGTRLNRRHFLTGVATSSLGASFLTSTASAATTRDGIGFDRVVDAVDDLGLDASGSNPVDGALGDALQSGTLIEFPPGEYRFEEGHSIEGMERVGIRGTGESPRDVTFTTPQGSRLTLFGSFDGSNGPVLVENCSLQQRRDDETLVTLHIRTPGGSVVRDVEWLGQTPSDTDSDYNITVETTSQDGVTLVERIATGRDAPAVSVDYPNGVQFLRGGGAHSGEVIIRDITVRRHNSNAMRYTNCDGVVTVEGGEFVNNQNANLRFGAGNHPSKVSSATGTRVVADGSRHTNDAVRLDGQGQAGAQFRDVTIEWSRDGGRGVIAAPDWGGHGRAEFHNCTIRNDGDLLTVNAEAVDVDEDAIVFENCNLSGSGGDFVAQDRPGSVLRNCCVEMPNASFDGFEKKGSATSCGSGQQSSE